MLLSFVHVCACTHVEIRGQPQVFFLGHCPPFKTCIHSFIVLCVCACTGVPRPAWRSEDNSGSGFPPPPRVCCGHQPRPPGLVTLAPAPLSTEPSHGPHLLFGNSVWPGDHQMGQAGWSERPGNTPGSTHAHDGHKETSPCVSRTEQVPMHKRQVL